ncbi:PKD domain-containing protein [Chitinophaga polysaccharea]|uniref:PKD domain-containing protein n=1 Tax=Chitinophaga polysaccharea TaxID=1293035 RepID=A0A561PCU4_9BACT|nr:PKD domain-containing protein [Chitinophaga polysaccharea]TWF35890.1 PKD domain-containing protein [Chitinophaga polysaccharea]
MQKKLLYIFLLLCAATACKKDNNEPAPLVVYTVNVDGYTVTFNNTSTGATSWKWDFGDSTTSTEKSPVHTYKGKGKYVPTLYATSAAGVVADGSTVLRISKTSPVKLNDNSLADWDTISQNMITAGPAGGVFKKAKFDYDGQSMYFYVEMTGKVADGVIFDVYIDSDNSAGTGLLTALFTGGGYDVLLEGQLLLKPATAAIPMAMYYHTGAQTSFSFDQQSGTDFYSIGTVQEANGVIRFEGKLDRSKIKGFTGAAIRLGMVATTSDWGTQLGTIPDEGAPSFLLNMPE